MTKENSAGKKAGSLTHGLEPALRISFDVTIVANLMAFAGSPKNAARFGIKTREWRVIGLLYRVGPTTAADIVRMIHQDKASVSRAVAALEKRDLVRRTTNPGHARSPFISLTPAGRSLVKQIWPVFREQARRMTEHLSNEEQELLCSILDKLRQQAEVVRLDMDN